MKNLKFPFMLLFIFFFILNATAVEKNNKEKESIKKVIVDASKAFFERDLEKLKAYYVQDKDVTRIGSDKSFYSYLDGWDEINSNYISLFKKYPEPLNTKYKKTNFKIKVYEKSAWAIHDEIFFDADGEVSGEQKTFILWKRLTVNGKSYLCHLLMKRNMKN